jgi:hypothetical protein
MLPQLELDGSLDPRGERENGLFSNGLVQLTIGAIILWMGKTTFEHAGD